MPLSALRSFSTGTWTQKPCQTGLAPEKSPEMKGLKQEHACGTHCVETVSKHTNAHLICNFSILPEFCPIRCGKRALAFAAFGSEKKRAKGARAHEPF